MSEIERKVNRTLLRYAVSRNITCDVTGAVLDVRSAVAVTAVLGDKAGTSVLTGCRLRRGGGPSQ